MKLLLTLLGLLLVVVGIVAVVGSLLPRDHVATMTVTVNATQYRVWSAIADPAAYPTWRTGVKSTEVVSPSPLTWSETTSMGTMNLVADEFQPPAHMVARITDKNQPFGGEWEYELAPDSSDANKTRVTITERGWVSNVVFRFVSQFVMGHYSTIDTYLRSLSRKFGPEAVPKKIVKTDTEA